MQITFLGTGTSTGIPVIACNCEVCHSKNKKNRRTRASLLVQYNGRNIIIDTAPELRLQCLACSVTHLDALLFTHTHADHVRGLDDIRVFNMLQDHSIPCYGNRQSIHEIRSQFSYIFAETQEGGGKPKIDLFEVDQPFELFGRTIVPLAVKHGIIDVLGFRIDNFAYITDASEVPKATIDTIQNLDTLVINALRHKPHVTHLSLDEALDIVRQAAPRQTFLTHLSHKIDHDAVQKSLPQNVNLAYDSLSLGI